MFRDTYCSNSFIQNWVNLEQSGYATIFWYWIYNSLRLKELIIKIIVHFDVIWCHIPFVALSFFLYSKSNKMTSHIRSLTLELAEDIGFVYRIRCFCWICPIKHRKDICHYNLERTINCVFSFERTTRKDKKNFGHYSHLSQKTSFGKTVYHTMFNVSSWIPWNTYQ